MSAVAIRASVIAVAAYRCLLAAGPAQDQPQWLFVAIWPAQAGPESVAREELWADESRQSWRRIRDRDVVAALDASGRRTDDVSRLRSIAGGLPPVSRSRGAGGSTVDAPVARYLQVVLGRGSRFTEWSGEEASLPAPLVTAAMAAMASARPAQPSLPAGVTTWIQAVAADPALAALFEREGRVASPSPAQIAAVPPLARALRLPFSWVPVTTPAVSLDQRSVLQPSNPVGLVRSVDAVFQIILQRSSR